MQAICFALLALFFIYLFFESSISSQMEINLEKELSEITKREDVLFKYTNMREEEKLNYLSTHPSNGGAEYIYSLVKDHIREIDCWSNISTPDEAFGRINASVLVAIALMDSGLLSIHMINTGFKHWMFATPKDAEDFFAWYNDKLAKMGLPLVYYYCPEYEDGDEYYIRYLPHEIQGSLVNGNFKPRGDFSFEGIKHMKGRVINGR